MKVVLHWGWLCVALLLFAGACRQGSSPDMESASPCGVVVDSTIKLGDRINNPYSLPNMQQAYNSLLQQALATTAAELTATHQYVRFLPKDSLEYELLRCDTTLELFGYPLDYKVTEGSAYKAEGLSYRQLPWQYTKVPVDYDFPPVRYEVLDGLYLPVEQEGGLSLNEETGKEEIVDIGLPWELLLHESLKLTGNLDTTGGLGTQGWLPDKWTPSVTITVWDDLLQTCIPLEGVKVRARHFLHWTSSYTNKHGYAAIGSFYGAVNYSISWERNEWDIRDGNVLQAYYNGPNAQTGPWTLHINGGRSQGFATLHRALYRYVFKDVMGMSRPTFYRAMKIAYIDENDPGYLGIFYSFPTLGIIPDIQIYSRDTEGKARTSNEIFATTIHELGHAAHFGAATLNFALSPKWIKEGWAKAAEWAITRHEYDEWLRMPDYQAMRTKISLDDPLQKIWTTASPLLDYSPIFIDLNDTFNQRSLGDSYPNDEVSGYDISTINELVNASVSMKELKQNVWARKPVGISNEQLQALFEVYEQVF